MTYGHYLMLVTHIMMHIYTVCFIWNILFLDGMSAHAHPTHLIFGTVEETGNIFRTKNQVKQDI